jgi:two-component system chemotaxis response regulator CheY
MSVMALDVLIVDDSAAIRKILHRVLLQTNLILGQVHEANDGNEALERMRTESVGLVLSDINMPNMDGLEFLKAVKANPAWHNIPVMMVTTEGSQDKVMQALKLGAAGYVKKPFTPDQIKDKLNGLI